MLLFVKKVAVITIIFISDLSYSLVFYLLKTQFFLLVKYYNHFLKIMNINKIFSCLYLSFCFRSIDLPRFRKFLIKKIYFLLLYIILANNI